MSKNTKTLDSLVVVSYENLDGRGPGTRVGTARGVRPGGFVTVDFGDGDIYGIAPRRILARLAPLALALSLAATLSGCLSPSGSNPAADARAEAPATDRFFPGSRAEADYLAAEAEAGEPSTPSETAPESPEAVADAPADGEPADGGESPEAVPADVPECGVPLFDAPNFRPDPNLTIDGADLREDFYSPENPTLTNAENVVIPAGSDRIVTLYGFDLSPLSTLVFTELSTGCKGFLPYNAGDSRGYPLRDNADATSALSFFVAPTLDFAPGDYSVRVVNPYGTESNALPFSVLPEGERSPAPPIEYWVKSPAETFADSAARREAAAAGE
jgi:hypothetical protein